MTEPVESWPDLGYRYVTTPEGLAECAAALAHTSVLAADIEGDSFFSYTEKTCLLQLTGDSGPDWVVDPLLLPDLEALRPLMEDRSVVKIFHGADYDIVSLKRDHGFAIGPIFDTMIAAQATGHERFGLQDLVQSYFGDLLDKKYQRHDWSSRPLRDEHLEYARHDTHYLPRLRELLLAQAVGKDRLPMLEEEFGLLEAREWTGRPFDADDCLKITGAQKLTEGQQRVLRALFRLRDGIASKKNRPGFKVWGNDVMLLLARTPPATREVLDELLGDRNYVARRYGEEVLAAIAEGLADTSRIPARRPYEAPTRNLGVPQFTRDDEPLFVHLRSWRNDLATAVALAPAMIVNNTVLKLIAALKPQSVEDLRHIDDMRVWQRDEFGAGLVQQSIAYLAAHPTPGEGAAEGDPDGEPRRRRRRRRRRGGPGPFGDAPPGATGGP